MSEKSSPTLADYRAQLLDNASLCYAIPKPQLLVTWISTLEAAKPAKDTRGYIALVSTNADSDDPRVIKVSKPVPTIAEGILDLLHDLNEDTHGNVISLIKMQIEDSGSAVRHVLKPDWEEVYGHELKGRQRPQRDSIESIESD